MLIETEGGLVFPFIDAAILTRELNVALSTGAFAHVPIIHGTNDDELRLMVALRYDDSLTDADMSKLSRTLIDAR